MREEELCTLELFDRAAHFALQAHRGQMRKGGKIPYVLHVMEAASIAATMTDDREIVAAAMLHDTVEDTETTPETIERLFGCRVSSLVASETEDKMKKLPAESTWKQRKEASLRVLESAGTAEKIIWLSDKLSNMRSFYRLKREKGANMWDGFHQKDPREHEWYYRAIAKALRELEDTAAYEEYTDLVNRVFA